MMQTTTILRIFGLLLMLWSIAFIPPLLVEQWYRDGYALTFILSFCATFGAGFLIWFLFRHHRHVLRAQDGFLIIVMIWISISLVSALPFYWAIRPDFSFTDAFFESVSGLTTTGATILTDLETLPHALLYYRQQLQFLGGISIIILAVAIIPTLGIGGMQLFRTEITGPVKDDKLTPRVTHTAKAIWLIYVTMTAICAICFWMAGMDWFDAIGHSFGTVSTGGFSTHNASFAYFPNPYIKVIAIVFMFLGAVNFSLHYLMFKRKKISVYFQDPEFMMYVKIIFSVLLITWISLVFFYLNNKPTNDTFLDTLFQIVSLITTSGYSSVNISNWPGFIPLMLLFCGIIGGCAGSTAGGLKAIRVLLLQKQGFREIRRLVHPHGQYVIKLGDKQVSQRVIEAIWGFFVIYCVVFTFLLLLLLIGKYDFFTVYTALIACFSNTGYGLGGIAQHFANLSDYTKWVLSFAMIAGRLEIFTILVLFSPAFWRR